MTFLLFKTGDKELSCSAGTVIGQNTGVYIGGLPPDYMDQRDDNDFRAEVSLVQYWCGEPTVSIIVHCQHLPNENPTYLYILVHNYTLCFIGSHYCSVCYYNYIPI